jgi:hypothetical protein
MDGFVVPAVVHHIAGYMGLIHAKDSICGAERWRYR